MEKAPMVLAYTKQAVRNVGDMDMNMAYEYLATKGMALRAVDSGGTRERGMTEFLDKKTYRPGLGPVSLEDE
jgi:trans-feruloyl-CoA hydratase/vanillin synthase